MLSFFAKRYIFGSLSIARFPNCHLRTVFLWFCNDGFTSSRYVWADDSTCHSTCVIVFQWWGSEYFWSMFLPNGAREQRWMKRNSFENQQLVKLTILNLEFRVEHGMFSFASVMVVSHRPGMYEQRITRVILHAGIVRSGDVLRTLFFHLWASGGVVGFTVFTHFAQFSVYYHILSYVFCFYHMYDVFLELHNIFLHVLKRRYQLNFVPAAISLIVESDSS